MNSSQYLDGSNTWRPPSPNSTPHSTKFNSLPFQSPPQHDPSFNHFDNAWVTPRAPASAFASSPTYTTPTFETPTVSSNWDGHSPTVVRSSSSQDPPAVSFTSTSMAGYNQAVFPSNSFIEQFDNTNIQDTSTSFSMMPPQATPPNHMQTPPPTRDSSSRKQAQHTRFAPMTTPSAAHNSRRMSAPGDGSLQRPWEGQMPEASPAVTFTPLQFSPPNPAFMSNLGPMTAPAYPQGALFWDPNSNYHTQQAAFVDSSEDPFVANSDPHDPAYTFQRPTNLTIPPRYDPRPVQNPVVYAGRPQSARPAESQQARNPSYRAVSTSMVSSASGVDPSVLWTAPSSDLNQSFYGMPDNRAVPIESRKPYELQLEQMRREKEMDRDAKPLTRAPELAANVMQNTLRRSLTDPRKQKAAAHRSRLSQASEASSADLQEVTRGMNEAPFPRTASPLKRPNSYDHKHSPSPLKTPRRSVVLTVDEKGTARTEVTAVDDGGSPTKHKQPSSSQAIVSENESDEESVEILNSRGSSRSGIQRPAPRPTSQSDAQSALREIVRDRRQKRLGEMS